MKLIQEITSRILNDEKNKSLSYSLLFTKDKKLEYFLKLITQKPLTDEEKIAQQLCFEHKESRVYKFLKRRLLEQLFKVILLLDYKSGQTTAYQKAYYECWISLSQAKILLGKSAIYSAQYLLERIVKLSLKYDFTILAMEASRILQFQDGCYDQNPKKFNYYHQIYLEQKDIFLAESKAEHFYTQVQQQYITNKKQLPVLCEMVNGFYHELLPLSQKFPTIKLKYITYLFKARHYALKGNFPTCISTCQEALIYFDNKTFKYLPAIFSFLSQLLISQLRLKRFQEAQATYTQIEQNIPRKSNYWLVAKHLQLLLALHSTTYVQAANIIKQVKSASPYKALHPMAKERWLVNDAYVSYILAIQGASTKIRFPKLANDLRIFKKDKAGNNTALLIVKVAWLIHKKQFQKVISLYDTILTYCSRYLRQPEALRANYFLKMLLQCIKADFHPVASQRKAAPYLKKLKEIPFEHSIQPLELELIPFEHFWKLVLADLERKD